MTRLLMAGLRLADQQSELSLNPIGGALKRGVENVLYRRPRDDVRIPAPVGDRADRYAQVLRIRLVGHAEGLPKQIRMATGPRRDYLHARLPAKRSAHAVMLRAATAPRPSGHARTRSTNARTTAGVTVMWRAARSLWSLACD